MPESHNVTKIVITILISLFIIYMVLYTEGLVIHDNCDDRQIFQFIGWSISQGAIPYQEVWENKGPVILLFNSLAYWICPNSDLGIEFLCAITHVCSFIVLYFAYKRVMPARIAAAMMLSCIAWYLSFSDSGNWNSVESMYVEFSALGLALLTGIIFAQEAKRLECLLLGGLVALSMLTKPNFVGLGCFASCSIVCSGIFEKNWNQMFYRLLHLCIGWVLVVMCMMAGFYLAGNLHEMLDATLLFNLLEYDVGMGFFSHPLLRTLGITIPVPELAQSGSIAKLIITEGVNICIFICLCAPFVLLLIYSISSIFNRNRRLSNYSSSGFIMLSATMWFFTELAASAVKANTYKHYYVAMAVPAYLLIGYGYSTFRHRWEKVSAWLALVATFVFLLPFAFKNMYIGEKLLCTSSIPVIKALNPNCLPIPTYSGTKVNYLLRKCEMRIAQKYTNNRLYYVCTNANSRIAELDQDLLYALRSNKSDLFISDVPMDAMCTRDPEIMEELSRYSLHCHADSIYIYSLKRQHSREE